MKNRRRQQWTAHLSDLVAVALVVLLNPLCPWAPQPPRPQGIPDKVECYVPQVLSVDSLQNALSSIREEIDAMNYYLKVHNVTDDGFHLVANYNTCLQQEYRMLLQQGKKRRSRDTVTCRRIPASRRTMIAVKTKGGHWFAGHYLTTPLNGKGIVQDWQGRVVKAQWEADTIVSAVRSDSTGIYRGQMDRNYMACGQGTMDEWDGCHKEGFWKDDRLHGFAFDSSPQHQLRIGEWKEGRFLGEKIRYTNDRIYGIDISRHQHEKGRRRYGIQWKNLRITSLGKRHATEGRTYPVSFLYIKSTEGTNIRNRYFLTDYLQAHKHGIHVGAYHFFSLRTPALAQARYFTSHTVVRKDDFPPVLDVEPSEAQIKSIGGDEELMKRIRIWMNYVERMTHKRPILYVSQMFINKHMASATDIKQHYNIWIARYGQYKPDVRLVYWQLCPDGRVSGITGEVDINVFNGYQGQFDEFVRTGFHK